MVVRPINVFLALSCTLVLLSACKESQTGKTYTYGPASATGAIIQSETSLVRRGTHVLRINGEDVYFLESKTENLQEFDGKTVFVEGMLQPNVSEAYLPVLVVSRLKDGEQPSRPHEWRIPALGITVTTPDAWRADITNDIVTFRLTGSGDALLTLTKKNGSTLPKGGATAYADGRRGVREIDKSTGLEDVYFTDGISVLRLHFTPDATIMSDTVALSKAHREFDDILRSLKWTSGVSASGESVPGGTGSSVGAGTPCGGPAGILCPSGYYCDVFDTASDIGKCRRM